MSGGDRFLLDVGFRFGLGSRKDRERRRGISDGAAMIFARSTSQDRCLSRWPVEVEDDEWR